ncbi:MAG: hypothetical protein FWG74_07385 [Planctomycetes bacterium]|nr:hypothetical protein [Planctomycetota bacterium]
MDDIKLENLLQLLRQESYSLSDSNKANKVGKFLDYALNGLLVTMDDNEDGWNDYMQHTIDVKSRAAGEIYPPPSPPCFSQNYIGVGRGAVPVQRVIPDTPPESKKPKRPKKPKLPKLPPLVVEAEHWLNKIYDPRPANPVFGFWNVIFKDWQNALQVSRFCDHSFYQAGERLGQCLFELRFNETDTLRKSGHTPTRLWEAFALAEEIVPGSREELDKAYHEELDKAYVELDRDYEKVGSDYRNLKSKILGNVFWALYLRMWRLIDQQEKCKSAETTPSTIETLQPSVATDTMSKKTENRGEVESAQIDVTRQNRIEEGTGKTGVESKNDDDTAPQTQSDIAKVAPVAASSVNPIAAQDTCFKSGEFLSTTNIARRLGLNEKETSALRKRLDRYRTSNPGKKNITYKEVENRSVRTAEFIYNAHDLTHIVFGGTGRKT